MPLNIFQIEKKQQKMEFGFSSCKSGKIIDNKDFMEKLWRVFFFQK